MFNDIQKLNETIKELIVTDIVERIVNVYYADMADKMSSSLAGEIVINACISSIVIVVKENHLPGLKHKDQEKLCSKIGKKIADLISEEIKLLYESKDCN